MVWRIHFTADDLARIQVSPTLGPLAETVLAMVMLRSPTAPRALAEWRGQVQGRITPQMKPLTALIPPGTKGVDLCTLTGEARTIEQGVQALLAVPREYLLVEMGHTDRHRRHSRLSPAAWALAEPWARPDLAEATQAAYQALVQPYWSRIGACLHAEQAARRRTSARGGAARRRPHRQPPPGRRGAARAHVAGRGTAAGRLGPARSARGKAQWAWPCWP